VIILSAIGAGIAASQVSAALSMQFDSEVIGIVSMLGILGVIVSLCIASDGPVAPAIVSTVFAVVMWLTVGVGLAINPNTLTIGPSANIMHVMSDGTAHFPGSSYEREIWPGYVRTEIPLTYQVTIYTDHQETLGQTGKSVTLRTNYEVVVRLAPTDSLATKIRGYMSQKDISIKKTFEVRSRELARVLIGRYIEEYPNTPIETGLRLPYTLPWVESLTVIKVTEELI
jgi:hypothetical protein